MEHKDNKQLAHHLTELLVNHPERFPAEMLGLIQARTMREITYRLQRSLDAQLAELDKRIRNFGKGRK